MDREANYVAVGAFVLLVILLGAGFVVWYSNAGDAAAQKRYEVYFEGSVSGLSEGSSGEHDPDADYDSAAAGSSPRITQGFG